MTESADHESGTLPTGDLAVDRAVARLDDLDGLDLDQHTEVYEHIHAALRSALDGAGEPGHSTP